MASQTKVDSAGRTARERAAERRAAKRGAEATSESYAPDTSASGTFSARTHEDELVVADSDFAVARSSQEDEDVSLDELMMSDSAEEDEEEEEATDIHPGLSEAVLAESLRAARGPAPAAGVPEEDTAALQAPVPAAPALALGAEEALELAEEDSSPSSSYPEAPSSEPKLEAEALAAPAAADAARGATAEEDEPLAEEDSSVELELPSEPGEELSVGAAEPSDEAASEDTSNEQPVQAASSLSNTGEEELAPPDTAVSEVIDLAPESEAVVPSSAFESVGVEAEAGPAAEAMAEPEEQVVPADDLEEGSGATEPAPVAAAERQTLPDMLAAKRRDAPLPSFDIPDLEARALSKTAVDSRSRVSGRPVALPPLSEIDEDDEDDDAVTHMGLPSVPGAANDFPASGGFQVADPAVAALESLDADISRGDTRRATTRVIPRVDPKSIPPKPRVHAPRRPAIAEQLGGLLRAARDQLLRFTQPENGAAGVDAELSPARQRFSWMVENVLPPLSLVLFGSGLGAGVIMLVENRRTPDGSTQTVQALQESSPRGPLTLAERARAGEGEALYKITNMPQGERTSALTLALEAGYQAQKQREFREFAKSLSATSGTLPAASSSRMVDYATSPETMLAAFAELTQWAGPVGPDVLYAVWEKAAGGSRAASLAQQLLYSADQRAKATPALVVALDLRSAANCDDYLRVLPAVQRSGDQRSSATLRALRHNDGCGADGQQDCYACLRDSSLLEDALKAIDAR